MTQTTKLVRGQHSATLGDIYGVINDVYEVVTFIKDNVPIRDEVVMKSEFEDRLAKMECRLVTKSYLDDKLANVVSEIGERINRVKDKGKLFNRKLVNYLDKHTVFETSEINELKELI